MDFTDRNDRFPYPFILTSTSEILPFDIPEAWKKSHISYYREYPPPPPLCRATNAFLVSRDANIHPIKKLCSHYNANWQCSPRRGVCCSSSQRKTFYVVSYGEVLFYFFIVANFERNTLSSKKYSGTTITKKPRYVPRIFSYEQSSL